MGRTSVAVLVVLACVAGACAPADPPVASTPARAPLSSEPSREVREALPAVSRAAADVSPVPVLVFPDRAWAAQTVVTSGLHFAAVSVRRDGRTMSVHATDVAIDAPQGELPPTRNDRVRGRVATMLVNEGIRSIAWEEGEVSYVLEIECEDPEGDVFCSTEAPIRGLAESLVRIGGGR